MDGTGNAFIDSGPFQRDITVTGNATQSAAQSKFGGKSAAFDGSGDGISFIDLQLGTEDFVIEMFFKTDSVTQYTQLIGNESSGGSSGFSLLINHGSATDGQIAMYNGGLRIATQSGDWSDNQWHYLALVRTGTALRLYIDGAINGTSTFSGSFTGDNYHIGRNNVFGSRDLSGNIDEVRITKGNNRGYTGETIPVPAVAFLEGAPGTDPFFSNVSLLLHADGNLTDSSSYAKTLSTVGTVATAGAAKYGSASFSFSGSGRLVVPSHASTTFDGNFTIECFVKFSAKPSNYIALFAGSSGATQMFLTTKVSGNGLRWGLSEVAEYASGDFTWALDTWYHVAVRRSINTVTLWVDGTNITSGTPANSTTYSGGFNLFGGIGSVTDFSGLVDEFRITKNVARAVIVPTEAFPNSA